MAVRNAGLSVSVLGFEAMGCAENADCGPAIDDVHAGRLLCTVLDGGINFVDRSIDYGPQKT
ncbi:hypothetical protein [Arthrobacter mobilis]|uniref:Uncharacterized protein n=1 Tax=Arthrobacter mobilis TaxID=2724944 RepID=A0A7X6K5L1_9MICC|nr:hypothetical protein [Arthrobacter mobilis]NKX55885.1 hypothetical protein [Arthrobacter mobilis]